MAAQDLHQEIAVAESLSPAARTATEDGTGVDLSNFQGVVVAIALGTFAGTSPSATLQIQDSADDASYTEYVPSEVMGGALPIIDTTNDEQVIERGYQGPNQFVRVSLTAISGVGATLPCSAVIVRGHPSIMPI